MTLPPAPAKGVRRAVALGSAAYPGVSVDEAAFAAFLDERRSKAGSSARLEAADLFLAFACLAGDRAALELLSERLLPQAVTAVSRIDGSAAFAQEVLQQMRVRLVMGSGRAGPKLATYEGSGPLARWLRTVAIGVALDLARSRTPAAGADEGSDEVLLQLPGSDIGGEMAVLKARHQKEFQQAFREALQELTARERSVLRLRFADGLTAAEIGAFHSVHRTTVMRMLDQLPDRLLAATRERLSERLRLNRGELDSLIAVIRSGLHLSLASVLKKAP